MAHALANEAALAEIVARYRAASITSLLIKGPATARLLYDDPNERPPGDLDLLVAPSDFARAGTVLARLDFEDRSAELFPQGQPHHSQTWVREAPNRVVVDLHRSLWAAKDHANVFAVLSRHTSEITVGQISVNTPDASGSALIVALHAAQHPDTLKIQEDLRRAVARLPAETWRAAAALAHELGVGEAFTTGLVADPAAAALARRLIPS